MKYFHIQLAHELSDDKSQYITYRLSDTIQNLSLFQVLFLILFPYNLLHRDSIAIFFI